jgi:hypothetical protein
MLYAAYIADCCNKTRTPSCNILPLLGNIPFIWPVSPSTEGTSCPKRTPPPGSIRIKTSLHIHHDLAPALGGKSPGLVSRDGAKSFVRVNAFCHRL